MTYAGFLVLFLLPPMLLVVIGAAVAHSRRPDYPWRLGAGVAGVLTVTALVWTTPWDSWIIRRGVWSYPAGSITGTLFAVPIEEFCFMAGQTVLVSALTLWLISRRPHPSTWVILRRASPDRPVYAALWLTAAAVGAWLVESSDEAVYVGSMLTWFGPLLALQRAVGADVLRSLRWLRAQALSVVGYLWAADRIALHAGTWRISEHYTTGIHLAGLPVEEMAFFAVTSMLVVDGLLLAVHPAVLTRMKFGHTTSQRQVE